MALVLDASVAVSWSLRDEESPLSSLALNRLISGDTAIVPQLWWFEVRNALLVGLRRGRTDQIGLSTFLPELSALTIRYAKRPSEVEVLTLAQRHNLTFYDACYLELAMRERLPLATLDRKLAGAATAAGATLLSA